MTRMSKKSQVLLTTLLVMGAMVLHSVPARAAPPADVEARVQAYKQKLMEWATDPTIVKAVKESNASGGTIPGMNNGKWDELAESDPQITAILNTPASKLVKQWEGDKGINKLFVRDEKGNMVAGSGKSVVYNAAARPPFKEAMKGKPWNADEVKPDPTTQIKSVHVSAPIMDGGAVIGVIHTAVTAE